MSAVEMPHRDNPLIDTGKLYGPGTWQAAWYRERHNRLLAKIDTEKRERPMSEQNSLPYIGGPAARYLPIEEEGALWEAAVQIGYVERCLAQERVAKRRADRLAGKV